MANPTSAIRPIEAAVRALVIADSAFNTRCPGGIGSDEVENQEYPFVLISGAHERKWNTMGGRAAGNGRDVILRLHIYSLYKGDREAALILERLVELLDMETISVSGYNTVMCEYQAGRVLIEANKEKVEVRHIPAEFRVRVHD